MAKKSAPELIDEHVSVAQSQRAVDALLKHVNKVQEEKAKTELLPEREQHMWLVLTVKQMQAEKKLNPFKIPIVHPLVDPREASICLISKDPQRDYKDLLDKHNIKFISRVVGVEKLKGKFKGYEEKRMLLKENGLFLADERVIPLLPPLLGKKFFQAKKQPIPVCLTRKDLKSELERAISSTYFHQNQGTCSSIKIGVLSQSSAQILANLKTALPAVIKHIKGGWDNVQSLHIKTSSSASLPIWTCELGSGDGGRWDGLVAEDVEMSGSDDRSDEQEDDGAVEQEDEVVAAKKGKKRAAAEEAVVPKKKAKAQDEPPKGAKKAVPSATTVNSPSDKPKKEKKTKTTDAPGPSSSTAKDSTGSALSASKKKKRTSALTDPDLSLPPAPLRKTSIPVAFPSPTTPGPSKQSKAARALAADFFETTPASAAAPSAPPPPNTPADGLLADTPGPSNKKKRKGKVVAATPLSAAFEKLADESVSATPSKISKARAQQSSDVVANFAAKELKQKRSATAVEKKKAKSLKGKSAGQSAKQALIGKKGLNA